MIDTDAAGGPARHIPVLLDAVLDGLRLRDGARFIDGTFGAGGYAAAMLAAAECQVLGIDRDPEAIAEGQALVARSNGRLTLVEGNFAELDQLAAEQGFAEADGVTLDVGVSSMQLDRAERGFSFRLDGPLDMRMAKAGPTAADAVNGLPEEEIANILFTLGEERRSRAIARAIVRARGEAPITTTARLAEIVAGVLGPSRDGRHPATRTFQALRIYVNDELEALEAALGAAEQVLKPEGRLAVVTFHSLEDRLVKRFLSERSGRGGVSRHLPEAASRPATFRPVGRQPVTPAEEEIARNPRARSAKLRTAERTAAAAWTVEGRVQ